MLVWPVLYRPEGDFTAQMDDGCFHPSGHAVDLPRDPQLIDKASS
jgi:hypothetical protein